MHRADAAMEHAYMHNSVRVNERAFCSLLSMIITHDTFGGTDSVSTDHQLATSYANWWHTM